MRDVILIDADDTLWDTRCMLEHIPEIVDGEEWSEECLRKAWDEFQVKLCDCVPLEIKPVATCIRGTLLTDKNIIPIFITSRESSPNLIEYTSRCIESFLYNSGLNKNNYLLLMRRFNDFGDHATVKEGILNTSVLGRFNILYGIDDNQEVIKMYERLNIPTLQFRYGGGDGR